MKPWFDNRHWLPIAALALMMLAPGAAAAGKKAAPKALTRAELPAGFVVGSGVPALALDVEIAEGKVVSSSPAIDGPGNLRATRSGDDTQTMLTVSSDLSVAVKFDLYMTLDGERFTYTGTCGLTPGISSFEMWRQPVLEFAMGNPRVVSSGRVSCD
ncbi:hypothetical protein [Pseudoxanthomonas putridarboris]|uniref:Uncharacterized protein n=1 Tax=Pseudoxanthomonas putridarboris TaxID=752605 RepID=A0ABU9J6Y6_9GAMM